MHTYDWHDLVRRKRRKKKTERQIIINNVHKKNIAPSRLAYNNLACLSLVILTVITEGMIARNYCRRLISISSPVGFTILLTPSAYGSRKTFILG